MAKVQSSYETVMILSNTLGEEGIAATAEKFKAIIAEKGTVDSVDEWGKRRLAYPINDETEGYYILINFTSAPEVPAELARVYNITDGVLRSLVIAKQ